MKMFFAALFVFVTAVLAAAATLCCLAGFWIVAVKLGWLATLAGLAVCVFVAGCFRTDSETAEDEYDAQFYADFRERATRGSQSSSPSTINPQPSTSEEPQP